MARTIRYTSVQMETELGSFIIDVDTERAPKTAGNFLAYVDRGLFDGSSFFRIVTPHNQPDKDVKISVIQGGLKPADPRCLPSIPHEPTSQTGLRHIHGAISMARPENGLGSCSFFICIGDQPELDYGGRRYEDHVGFAAFGHVREGMDIVERIFARAEKNPYVCHEIGIIRATRV